MPKIAKWWISLAKTKQTGFLSVYSSFSFLSFPCSLGCKVFEYLTRPVYTCNIFLCDWYGDFSTNFQIGFREYQDFRSRGPFFTRSGAVLTVRTEFSFWYGFQYLRSCSCRLSFVPRDEKKPTTRLSSGTNDYVNTKSHARKKPLLAGCLRKENDVLSCVNTIKFYLLVRRCLRSSAVIV